MMNLKKVILSVTAVILCAVSSFGNDDDGSNEVYFEGHRGETSVVFKKGDSATVKIQTVDDYTIESIAVDKKIKYDQSAVDELIGKKSGEFTVTFNQRSQAEGDMPVSVKFNSYSEDDETITIAALVSRKLVEDGEVQLVLPKGSIDQDAFLKGTVKSVSLTIKELDVLRTFVRDQVVILYAQGKITDKLYNEVLKKLIDPVEMDKIASQIDKIFKLALKKALNQKVMSSLYKAIDRYEAEGVEFTIRGDYFYDEFFRDEGYPGWDKLRTYSIVLDHTKASIKTTVNFDIGVAFGLKGGINVALGTEIGYSLGLSVTDIRVYSPHTPKTNIRVEPVLNTTLTVEGSVEAGLGITLTSEKGFQSKVKRFKGEIEADESTKEEVK